MNNRAIGRLAIGAAIGFTAIAAVYLFPRLESAAGPEEVAQAFFLDQYTWNFTSAWDRVSSKDQFAMSKDDYITNNPMPNTAQAALLEQLAKWGNFETIAIVFTESSRVVVSAHIHFPDLAQPEIREILARGADADADQASLLEQLAALNVSDQVQFSNEDGSFELVSEGNHWRVVQNWGHIIDVHFEAQVSGELPWDFYPIVDEVSALPGELVTVKYLARNNSDVAITGKAVHEVIPEVSARFLETIQCFCFTEQSLEPGEEREMVLLFTIDTIVPRDLTELVNLYTFYELDSFPSG